MRQVIQPPRKIFRILMVAILLMMTLNIATTPSAKASCADPGVFINQTSWLMYGRSYDTGRTPPEKLYYVYPGQGSTQYDCDSDSFKFVSVPYYVQRGGTRYFCDRGLWFGRNNSGTWGCWIDPYGITISWGTYSCGVDGVTGLAICYN